MHKCAAFFCVVLTGLAVNAQMVNLRGVVSNKSGQPVANAVVSLMLQGMKDTTGMDGRYTLAKAVAIKLPAILPQAEDISMDNGVLRFTLSRSLPVKVEIFNVKGDLLKKEEMKNAAAGEYRFAVARNCPAQNLLVVKASVGGREASFPYMTMNGRTYASVSSHALPVGSGMAKMAAVIDTLKTRASGYTANAAVISSYDTTVNVTLDTAAAGSTGSIGCGKDLSSIKSGTYTITSASLSRQYIIDIPATYDKNTPYRLIFGMHCYGSNMQGVAGDKYYQLKRFSDSTKNYCIFVAPNGTGSTPLWNQGAADHTFFDDMLKLFKENLCIDTTRVFSCGFSYGAMFTYSLSTNHQKQLRAVACYAPANWNIWLPTNTHEPIAYFQTTGTSDGNCPWIYDSTNQQGGKYCLLGHIKDNGCTVPSTIPLATTGTHVSTEFSGCRDGYPVKFGSFNGGHQAGPMDNASGDNSSKSWIPGETWKFFMQF